jgi:PleD family two-component response regulator
VAHLAGSLLELDMEAREIALTLKRPTRILVANSDPFTLSQIDACLLSQGYGVVPVSTFQEATDLLHALSPDLIVADVCLGAFNGLHLAARSLHHNPSRPVIITHRSYDPVLDRDARDLGAAFIVKPLDNPNFLVQVRAAFDEGRCSAPVA